MTCIQEFFTVTLGALRKRWKFEYLRRKAHGGILPDRGVKATATVLVPRTLGVNLSEALFGWNKQRGSPVQTSRRAPIGKHSFSVWIVKEVASGLYLFTCARLGGGVREMYTQLRGCLQYLEDGSGAAVNQRNGPRAAAPFHGATP